MCSPWPLMPHNHCISIFIIPLSDGVCVPSFLICVLVLLLLNLSIFLFVVCVCVLGFWLFGFGFWFGFPFSSKRKWNEDKIHVSSGILIKFFKWRKSKSIGAYYFQSSQEKSMRDRCLCCISSVFSGYTKVLQAVLQEIHNAFVFSIHVWDHWHQKKL